MHLLLHKQSSKSIIILFIIFLIFIQINHNRKAKFYSFLARSTGFLKSKWKKRYTLIAVISIKDKHILENIKNKSFYLFDVSVIKIMVIQIKKRKIQFKQLLLYRFCTKVTVIQKEGEKNLHAMPLSIK